MISIASDHGGYCLKEHIKAYLTAKGINVLDCGCDSQESCDYPIFAKAAAEAVADGRCEKGIVICTTGIGVSITANKVNGIRCALCSDPFCAEMTRRHNDANMLAMGAGIIGPNMAERIVDITATGTTLKENDLVVVDEVLSSTARFFSNTCAFRTDARIVQLANTLQRNAEASASPAGEEKE